MSSHCCTTTSKLSAEKKSAAPGLRFQFASGGSGSGASLLRVAGQFGRDHLNFFDRRRCSQELGRLLHQCGCDGAREMCLPSSLITENVKDAERRFAEPQGEPRRSCRLLLRQRESIVQELLQFSFFPGLCFQFYG